MACLLPARTSLHAYNHRSSIQEQNCSSSNAFIGFSFRRGVGSPLIAHAPVVRREQRFVTSPVARSIPVSGPGSTDAAGSSGGVAGQVTSELMDRMRAKICEALETETCTVTDMYGDGRHVSIDVVSKLFLDKSSMQRQRMVYKAIWMELQEAVHAVDSMSTKTPEEAAN